MHDAGEGAPGRMEPGAESAALKGQQRSSAADEIQKEEPARIGRVSHVSEIPLIGAFMQKHDALPLGTNKAVIKETRDGYSKTVGGYRFTADGVETFGDAPRPSEEEEAALTKEMRGITLPKRIAMTAIDMPPPDVDLNDKNTFVCHDPAGRIVAVRQRIDKPDGSKVFLTWTRWDDGKWRNVEPETLPFYGLPGFEDHSTLFVHEGEKSVRRVIDAMEDESILFPWREDMRWAHHIAWIGGVYAISRSDWQRLAKLPWKHVVIVADNDQKGERAAKRLSKFFDCSVEIASFDQRFGEGFDLGDDWPASLFDDLGRYIGPSFDDCLQPATQATYQLPPEGRGRPRSILREQFANEVAFTVEPQRYIFRAHPRRDLSADEFNATVRPFSHVEDTAAKVREQFECKHDKLIYDPRFGPGTVQNDGLKCFNVFEQPTFARSDGEAGPWIAFLEHLVPDEEDRAHLMRWLATLIARPEIRMLYGVLLISETQGVGKSTLGYILERLLGSWNVSFPSESSVVESQFNGWLARKRLVIINEFYSGTSRKAYDKMKAMITDATVEVNIKNVKQHELRNWAHFLACSNSLRALFLDDEDRRWMVPGVTEKLMPQEWWQDLYAWLEGDGLVEIASWAARYIEEHGAVATGEHAPWSKRKREIVEESMSDGKIIARDLGEQLAAYSKPAIVRLSKVREHIAEQRGLDVADRRLEKTTTITAVLKKVKGLTVWAGDNRRKVDGRTEALAMNFRPSGSPGECWHEIEDRLTDVEEIANAPM